MQQAQALADDRRSPAFNQAKLAAEALQALSWVVYSGPASGESPTGWSWPKEPQQRAGQALTLSGAVHTLQSQGPGTAATCTDPVGASWSAQLSIETMSPAGMNPPAQHVLDGWQSAEFWANKVLREHRASAPAQVSCLPERATLFFHHHGPAYAQRSPTPTKPASACAPDAGPSPAASLQCSGVTCRRLAVAAQVDWVAAVKGVLMALHGFVQAHHAEATQWNPLGVPAARFQPSPVAAPANGVPSALPLLTAEPCRAADWPRLASISCQARLCWSLLQALHALPSPNSHLEFLLSCNMSPLPERLGVQLAAQTSRCAQAQPVLPCQRHPRASKVRQLHHRRRRAAWRSRAPAAPHLVCAPCARNGRWYLMPALSRAAHAAAAAEHLDPPA